MYSAWCQATGNRSTLQPACDHQVEAGLGTSIGTSPLSRNPSTDHRTGTEIVVRFSGGRLVLLRFIPRVGLPAINESASMTRTVRRNRMRVRLAMLPKAATPSAACGDSEDRSRPLMHRRRPGSRALAAAAFAVILLATVPNARCDTPDGYSLLDLGTLGGRSGAPTAINARGWVVGSSSVAGDKASHAFLYDGARMRDLGTLDATDSYATGINASGQVVGYTLTAGSRGAHAFLYDSTGMHELRGLRVGTMSEAHAINDAGQIVGAAFEPWKPGYRPVLWDSTGIHDLSPPGTTNGFALGINNRGQIVGYLSIGQGPQHAFLYDSRGMHELTTPGVTNSSAYAIMMQGRSSA